MDDERQSKVTSKTGAKSKMKKGHTPTARGSSKSPRCSHATCGAAAATSKEEEAWERCVLLTRMLLMNGPKRVATVY